MVRNADLRRHSDMQGSANDHVRVEQANYAERRAFPSEVHHPPQRGSNSLVVRKRQSDLEVVVEEQADYIRTERVAGFAADADADAAVITGFGRADGKQVGWTHMIVVQVEPVMVREAHTEKVVCVAQFPLAKPCRQQVGWEDPFHQPIYVCWVLLYCGQKADH